jgi:hypothetical protein
MFCEKLYLPTSCQSLHIACWEAIANTCGITIIWHFRVKSYGQSFAKLLCIIISNIILLGNVIIM